MSGWGGGAKMTNWRGGKLTGRGKNYTVHCSSTRINAANGVLLQTVQSMYKVSALEEQVLLAFSAMG